MQNAKAADLGSAATEVLAEVVDQLPIGLTIARRLDGALVYANRAACIQGTGANSQIDDALPRRDTVDRTHLMVTVGASSYVVTTLIDATEHRRTEEQLARRAFFDELTGLPKRDLIEQTVDDMIGGGHPPFALSFIDIDNFKSINDYYGHAVGDQLLIKIARRIADDMRGTDLLARIGGDEFVLLTTEVASALEPGSQIARLSERLKEPFFIDGFEIFSSASIGVSLYPAHGDSYQTLRANADRAMYRVKASKKGGVRLFDEELSQAAAERTELEQRLRVAIRDKRVCCAYQAKVDFRSGATVGVEVLLRWRDESGDIQPPGDFIALAIELGLMDEVTMIVLDQAVTQIDAINDAFGAEASISINVAAKQAGDLNFMRRLAGEIAATGFAGRFILELTEEAFLSQSEFQRRILPMLREHGLRVSIDDFGVGYSSLSALAEITADELKVDRSFITDIDRRPRSQILLKVIESLGAALGMRIVVEGVETAEELAYLRSETQISCAQGFYFAKPIFLSAPVGMTGARRSPREASHNRGPLAARGRNGPFVGDYLRN